MSRSIDSSFLHAGHAIGASQKQLPCVYVVKADWRMPRPPAVSQSIDSASTIFVAMAHHNDCRAFCVVKAIWQMPRPPASAKMARSRMWRTRGMQLVHRRSSCLMCM